MPWPTKLQRMMEGRDKVSGVAPMAPSPAAPMHVGAPTMPHLAPLVPHMPDENTLPMHLRSQPQPRFAKLFTKK